MKAKASLRTLLLALAVTAAHLAVVKAVPRPAWLTFPGGFPAMAGAASPASPGMEGSAPSPPVVGPAAADPPESTSDEAPAPRQPRTESRSLAGNAGSSTPDSSTSAKTEEEADPPGPPETAPAASATPPSGGGPREVRPLLPRS